MSRPPIDAPEPRTPQAPTVGDTGSDTGADTDPRGRAAVPV